MKNFQLITIIVFIALAIFGILVFSGAIPIGNNKGAGSSGTVVLWGTTKTTIMLPLLEEFNNANPTFTVKYVQKSAESFDQDLLEALAEGKGPDMFFLPENLAFHYANKILPIPFASYSLASFKNNFVGAGEVFLTSKGILAFPLSVDPLVMYYNRSIFDASGIIYPPTSLSSLVDLVPKLIKKDDSNKIIKSAVALGHFSNITHAKDILATLLMQTGNRIVVETNEVFGSSLNAPTSNSKYNPAAVLKFYTNFADPNKEVYSWNKSFPDSKDAFSAENLAIYFGYASELNLLVNRNPNQNFSVAPFPQVENASFKLTGAQVTGISLLASSKNFNTAFLAASLLATGDFASKFALATGVAPARRDLLKIKPLDAYSPIFYDSALYARSWLDPSEKDTDNIFRNMIDGVLSNNLTVENAISDASTKLNLLLLK
ncbi:MAG: Extracellular solute-binding protein, family 1 [Parcubacteria group bacterium GW2011_GWB1_36_5]|nr:MAG: Extracellular solute-binding protein, family 1 [Parcubacteria group bacterium GW2011_GWB1_36_5]